MEEGIRTLSLAPREGAAGSAWGPGTSTLGCRPRGGKPLGPGCRRVRASALSSLRPHPHRKQAAQVPEGAQNAVGIVPPGVVQHPCLDVGNAWWAASLSCLRWPSAIILRFWSCTPPLERGHLREFRSKLVSSPTKSEADRRGSELV